MKLLLYEWNSYLQYDIKYFFHEKGISVEPFVWQFKDKNKDEDFELWFRKNVDSDKFDALFSINYWPMLSVAAQECGMKYIAWCYDNPLNVVCPEKTLGNPCNAVFFFDRIQTERYQQLGIETVHYLPLGVNANRIQKIELSKRDRSQYTADVSLIGSLYESRFYDIMNLVDERTKGYLDALMAAQQDLYGCYLFEDLITGEVVENINRYIKEIHPATGFRLLKEALTFAMASEVTRKERLLLLAMMGRRFDTRLYSFQFSEILQNVKSFPPVDYVTEMPKVFACTKVNLNPTLRCIQSGIPLRALDVMGAGGFLLSNYQPELAEYFVPEEELVLYESVEDAVEKTGYYLKHDDVRAQIAARGRQKVLEHYTMEKRMQEIMKIAIN